MDTQGNQGNAYESWPGNKYRGVASPDGDLTKTPKFRTLDEAQAETEKMLPEIGNPGQHRASFPMVPRNAKSSAKSIEDYRRPDGTIDFKSYNAEKDDTEE